MNILVTGVKGYVGTSLKKWLSRWPDQYYVDFISLRDGDWESKDITRYDVLFHAAAVVHKKETPEVADLYYRINRDLTIEVANKAKQSGVKLFIFMSSMSVYGLEGKVTEQIVINKQTPCKPSTHYGKSKLEAEYGLNKLEDENFKVATIRAPMIYGPNCPGNYERLKKLVMKFPVFPKINNHRSMIFIDNFSEFIRLLADNQDHGLYFPQNKEYINTAELVKLITKENSKRIYLSKVLAVGVKLLGKRMNVINKVFGSLVFERSLSTYKDFEYCIAELKESIEICENKI